jgi:uncharacterized protein (DUF2141 family)
LGYVEELPYGIYAVLVHHDIDASGKMERHWYWKPKVPTGVSNDAPARFGPAEGVGPIVPLSVDIEVKGRAALFVTIDERESVRFTNYEWTGT